jgi:hypothetical protein
MLIFVTWSRAIGSILSEPIVIAGNFSKAGDFAGKMCLSIGALSVSVQ